MYMIRKNSLKLALLLLFITTHLTAQETQWQNITRDNPDKTFDYFKHPLYEHNPHKTNYKTIYTTWGLFDGAMAGLLAGAALTYQLVGVEGDMSVAIAWAFIPPAGSVVGFITGGIIGYKKGNRYQSKLEKSPGYYGVRRHFGYSVYGISTSDLQLYTNPGAALVVRKWTNNKYVPNKIFFSFEKERYDGQTALVNSRVYNYWGNAKNYELLFQYAKQPNFCSLHYGLGLGYAEGSFEEEWKDPITAYIKKTESTPINTLYLFVNTGIEFNLNDFIFLQADVEFDPIGFQYQLNQHKHFEQHPFTFVCRIGRFIL